MKKKGLNLPKERAFIGPALVWKRLFAFVADLLIINLVLFFPFKRIIQKSIPEFASYSEAYSFLSANQSYTTTLTIVSLVMSLFAVLYFALLEQKLGQTPGKMLFNIFVISDVKKLSFWQCVVRSLFLIPVFPFFLLWIIDPLFLFFTKTNQRLSEILSKTRTVSKYVM
jgi:uncharacterized RDD family membrane protein YckC